MKSLENIVDRLHPRRINALAAYLLKDEAISGKLIIIATLLAIIAVNTGLEHVYESFWHTTFSIGLGDWILTKDLQHWVNEGLMAIFFLVVGLELKRELVQGELRHIKTAMLPFGAAIGGMIVPAMIYMFLNTHTETFRGWAIPMATDIAFAVGVLALLGSRVPSSIRLFLLTLAIVDDIGAVIVIAAFYSTGIVPAVLGAAFVLAILILALRMLNRLSMPVFVALALLFWLAIDASGVHASIAGALIGLMAPINTQRHHAKPIAERLEHFAIPISTLIVVPLFAFANTGISLDFASYDLSGTQRMTIGIVLGLVLGKVIGIAGTSWVMVKSEVANKPAGANWNHMLGVGMLAGIGFTVSIFVTELAFTDENLIGVAKLSIFAASIISGILGYFTLRAVHNAEQH